MPCVHLRQLYKLCEEHQLKLAGSDLIHLVCKQCDEKEVCPAVLSDEYDAAEKVTVDTERKSDSSG